MSVSLFQLWSHLEERFALSGEAPAGIDSNERIYRSIVRESSARSSEAHAIQGNADPLLALRALVYRGRLKEAATLAAELMGQVDFSSTHGAEIFLEQARILAMDGQWEECELLCSTALALPEMAPISRLTLFQIRAMANFELDRMSASVDDLERVDSLASVFPNCPSAFYAAAYRVKVIARDRGASSGQEYLQRLWTDLVRSPGANLDRILALLRMELDLERMAARVSPARLIASYRIAETTGETLYLSLAALEAAYSGIPAFALHFGPIAAAAARTLPKVRSLIDEIEGRSSSVSVSGALLAARAQEAPRTSQASAESLIEALPAYSSLLLARERVVVHLSPFAIVRLDEQPKLEKALLALSDGPVAMSAFFAKLWGRSRYSANLHSNLISSLLYRLRKKIGVSAKISGGDVRLENVLVLT